MNVDISSTVHFDSYVPERSVECHDGHRDEDPADRVHRPGRSLLCLGSLRRPRPLRVAARLILLVAAAAALVDDDPDDGVQSEDADLDQQGEEEPDVDQLVVGCLGQALMSNTK